MLIYLVRHAIAVERGTPGIDDDARPLTDKGRRRMKQVVAGLKRLGVSFDSIWTSPLIRARQTAELLTGLLKSGGGCRVVDALASGGDPNEVLKVLREANSQGSLALVGHEPDIGELCGLLLTGVIESPVVFRKGAVACLEMVPADSSSRGRLLWHMQPRALRRLVPPAK